MLEKTSVQKENMYNEIKLENDDLNTQIYKLTRDNEDMANDKKLIEMKLHNLEQ